MAGVVRVRVEVTPGRLFMFSVKAPMKVVTDRQNT
jgi:hypothetical protein